MKNKILGLTALAISSFGLIMGVNAATVDAWHGRDRGESEYTEVNGVVTIKLKTSSDAGLEVESGKNVILDLNGQTLTNYCVNNSNPSGCTGASPAIRVDNNATLKIIDSSNGNGKVTQKDNSVNMMTIDVHEGGNLIIDAGEYTQLATVGDGYSVILNNGNLTVNGGTFKSNAKNAAAIHNDTKGTIIFNGGDITSATANSWGFSNSGIATINNGKFTQGNNFSVIVNTGKLNIVDGEFSATGDGHNSLISTTGTGETNVAGGDFKTDTNNIFYEKAADGEGEEAGTTTVTGGSYIIGEKPADVTKYLPNEYQVDEEGNVILKDADYTEYEAVLAEAESKVKETTKYTEESIKALQAIIEEAKKISKELKSDEQEQIDEVVNNLKTAINALVLLPTDDPQKEDNNTPTKNPSTFDGLAGYVVLFTAAMGTLTLATKKLLKK